jgi:peptide/nickel transport system permease protein
MNIVLKSFSKISSISKAFFSLGRYARFKFGSAMLLIIAALAFTSMLAPPTYERWYYYQKDLPPQLDINRLDLILGTTTNGRPILWITLNALANSLYIGVLTALIASHIGLLIGLLAGLARGYKESILITMIDSFVSLPGLPLLIVLAMALKQNLSIYFIPLILSVIAWAWPARNVRSITVSVLSRDFIVTSSFSGIRFTGILFYEVLPYVIGWHITNFINTIIWAIGMETALAIFGLSILSKDTLGTMIYWALNYNALFRGLWWWLLPPVLLLILIFVSLYMISVSISTYLNPRLRGGSGR